MATDWSNRRSAAKGWTQQALIFLFFAALLGGYGSSAFAPYQDHQFRPTWERARWVAHVSPSVVTYFRKVVVLPTLPQKAALLVAATDSFSLYVNGKKLGDGALTSARPSVLFDLTQSLQVGRNVIAVRVERKTYPGQAEMIAEGSWRTGGATLPLQSDATWRVSNVESYQSQGAVPWHALEYNDSAWAHSAEVMRYIPGTVFPLSVPPRVLDDFPRGNWIWNVKREALRGTFLREFKLEKGQIESGWLGISTNGSYTVSVNDVAIYSAPTTTDYMDLLNIGPYLKTGNNRIAIDVAMTQPPGQLAVGVLVKAGGARLDLSSDHQWRSVARAEGQTSDAMEWTVPSVIRPILGVGARSIQNVQGTPTVRIISPDAIMGRFVADTYRAYPWALFVLVASIGLAVVFGSAARTVASVSWLQTTTLFAKPFLVIAAIMAFIFLLALDVRIDSALLFSPIGFALAVALTLLWHLAILIDLRRWTLSQGAPHA